MLPKAIERQGVINERLLKLGLEVWNNSFGAMLTILPIASPKFLATF